MVLEDDLTANANACDGYSLASQSSAVRRERWALVIFALWLSRLKRFFGGRCKREAAPVAEFAVGHVDGATPSAWRITPSDFVIGFGYHNHVCRRSECAMRVSRQSLWRLQTLNGESRFVTWVFQQNTISIGINSVLVAVTSISYRADQSMRSPIYRQRKVYSGAHVACNGCSQTQSKGSNIENCACVLLRDKPVHFNCQRNFLPTFAALVATERARGVAGNVCLDGQRLFKRNTRQGGMALVAVLAMKHVHGATTAALAIPCAIRCPGTRNH